MASTFWQLEGEKVEAVIDFKFFSSKITVDSDCVCVPSHFSGWLPLGTSRDSLRQPSQV